MKSFNSHNKIQFSVFFVLYFFLSVISLHAQVSVNLRQLPMNQLKIADLWNLTVTNNSNSDYRIYLQGTASEKNDGLIVEAKSSAFELKAHETKSFSPNNIGSAEVTWRNDRYKEIIIRTGVAPTGTYDICVSVKQDPLGEQFGSDCKEQVVEIVSRPILISPSNGDSISQGMLTFTWAPPVGMSPRVATNYRLKIVEINRGQPPEDAITHNLAFYQKDVSNVTTYVYPNAARAFEKGKAYAWRISLIQDKRVVVNSDEVWMFVVEQPRIINDIIPYTQEIIIRDAEFSQLMNLFLDGTQIQLNGPAVLTGDSVRVFDVPIYKWNQFVENCSNIEDPVQSEQCLENLFKRFTHLEPAVSNSYIKFYPHLLDEHAIETYKFFYIPPTKIGDAYAEVNNINTTLSITGLNFQASISDDRLNFDLFYLQSNHPTVRCYGNLNDFLGIDCPDAEMTNMNLSFSLYSFAATPEGNLTYNSAYVNFSSNMDLTGITGELAEWLTSAKADIKEKIEHKIKEKLLDKGVRAGICAAILAWARSTHPDVTWKPVVQAFVSNSNLVIKFGQSTLETLK